MTSTENSVLKEYYHNDLFPTLTLMAVRKVCEIYDPMQCDIYYLQHLVPFSML